MNKFYISMVSHDLVRTQKFYTALGFKIDFKSTNKDGVFVDITDTVTFIFFTPEFLTSYLERGDKKLVKNLDVNQVNSLCVNSKQEVIDLVNKALENGGTIYGLPQDYDTLYAHDIKDPDGNILEFIYST